MRASSSNSTMSSATSTDPGLRPWQLFLLAGMLAATAVVFVSTGQAVSGVIVLSLTVVSASLLAVAAVRMFAPLTSKDPVAVIEAPPAGGRSRAALEREKALVLRSIKELEFDHAMRKMATADYEEMLGRLKARAVGLMQRLDAGGYRDAIERDLASRAATPPLAQAPPVPTPVPQARTCAACRTSNDPDARFCKGCGASLMEPA